MLSARVLLVVSIYAVSFGFLYFRCRDRLRLSRYFSNHYFWLAPLNFVLTFFYRDRTTAVFAPETVPGLAQLKTHYPAIRAEAARLLEAGEFQRAPAVDEPGYNSFEKGGWRKFPLKWYSDGCNERSASLCPQTCAALEQIPAIRSAMFTVLPPRGKLGRHHDPVASSLRYHLGLLTPNSPSCALTLNGNTHVWRDGEELLFDQTFLHSAVNDTDQPRVILFCDVEKPQLVGPPRWLAQGINRLVVAQMTGKDSGRRTWLSRFYEPVYRFRWWVKNTLRNRSLLLYNVVKFSALALLVAALMVAIW